MKIPNIVYPETLEVIKDISEQLIWYSQEHKTFNNYKMEKYKNQAE